MRAGVPPECGTPASHWTRTVQPKAVTVHKIDTTFAGRRLTIESGKLAKQAAGSVMVRFGDTMVVAAVTVSPNISTLPFFPLTVEYKEKTYAAGKIPGGFIKREGRPSDKEILACRIIDRSIRPLFPEGFKNEVQVFVTVVSADQENKADVLALTATSYALAASRTPWGGPIASVRVGRIQGNWVLNPTLQQLEYSDMELVVAGSNDSIMMVEGGALEVSEGEVVEALTVAQGGIRELIAYEEELLKLAGRADKMEWERASVTEGLHDKVRAIADVKISEALNQQDKHSRVQAVELVKREVAEALSADLPDNAKEIKHILGDLEYNAMRSQVLTTKKRVDGRATNEVRPIAIDTSLLPRAHGSALFTRGQTQALVAATLGTAKHRQRPPRDRQPRHRGSPRRHGLQGRRNASGHHLDPDGHQDRGTRPADHDGSARAGEGRAVAHSRRDGQGAHRAARRPEPVRATHRDAPDQS